ncbi:MAG: DMT family transporter [Lautropia sp.]|nr:DMT family transporter [Lautropia sp.]
MTGSDPARRQALIAAHFSALMFGMTGILGALIRADAWVITSGRAVFAALALGLVSLWLRRPVFRDLRARQVVALVLGGIVLAAHWVTFFLAVKAGGVAVATLGFAAFPAFIALMDWLVFRERIGGREWGLLGLVTLGLVLVTPSFDFGDQGTVGLLWGLASGFTFALLAMMNRRATRGVDAVQVSFWQNLVVALVLLPVVSWGSSPGGDHQAVAQGFGELWALDWWYLGLLGILCTGLCHYLFVRSLDHLDARTVGMIVALEPVYAIACAWWLFSAQPSGRMLLGGVLIILATVLSAQGRQQPDASSAVMNRPDS